MPSHLEEKKIKRFFSNIKYRQVVLRYLSIFSGLFIVGNGIVITIQANLGVNPWDVLHIGIASRTGLSIGTVIQGVGFLLIAVSYFFGVKIYIGTLLNMVFLGLFVDLVIGWGYVPGPDLLWQRILLYCVGVLIFGFGVAVYIGANLGAGPRDSLMLALFQATSIRMGTIRALMEVVAAGLGFLLGGPLGIGTAIFALTVGYSMEAGFSIIRAIKKTAPYALIWHGVSSGDKQG